jgi:thymidylate synthase
MKICWLAAPPQNWVNVTRNPWQTGTTARKFLGNLMYLSDSTIDDLLYRVLKKLLECKNTVHPIRGSARELTGVLLQLTNIRSRLSRTEKKGKVFSCLGELLWYLSKKNDVEFIKYYVPRYGDETDDGSTIYGGYGPRLFKMHREGRQIDQVKSVLELLKKHPDSRRAVIQLFDAADIADDTVPDLRHREIPCTCTLQFAVRKKRLHMFTTMRSNDAFFGLPHDIFTFTMIQEIMARSLGIEPGRYKHFVGSLHLYEDQVGSASQYLKEGYQQKVPMPPMPLGDPWSSISKLLKAEKSVRKNGVVSTSLSKFAPYWADLVRLLQVYRYAQNSNSHAIAKLKKEMWHKDYTPYIEQKRQSVIKQTNRVPQQMPLFPNQVN